MATEGGVARRRPKELSVAKPITFESEPLPQKERSRGVTVSSVLGGWEETAHGSLGGLGGTLCWPGRGRRRGGGPAAATA